MKLLAALVAALLAGCVADDVEPTESMALGFWDIEFPADECDRPIQQGAVELTVDDTGNVSVWWELHSPERYEWVVSFTETGADVFLQTTDGPSEEYHLELADDGESASAVVTWRRIVGTEWCQVGPIEADLVRTR